jgi:hypothetical protein
MGFDKTSSLALRAGMPLQPAQPSRPFLAVGVAASSARTALRLAQSDGRMKQHAAFVGHCTGTPAGKEPA